MVYKGMIPWSDAHPVRVNKLSDTRFDVISISAKGEARAYHLTEKESESCDEWIEAIDEQLKKHF